jgi:dTMP kinase
MRGRFITLEGMDGAGKSTHLQWLAEVLRARRIETVTTREPGGTVLGERLRALVLDREQSSLHPETEALLMFAARRQHIEEVVGPALARGAWVVCDRFSDATYAYQAGGSGVAWEKIELLEQWVHPHLRPDLTLLFDLEPQVARQRARSERKAADRFEREGHAYFVRVREAYLRRARAAPDRTCILDASRDLVVLRKELEDIVIRYCLDEG